MVCSTESRRYAPAMYSFPRDQPVVVLDAKVAFGGLNNRERMYAHHLSRASYFGGLIVLLQTSPESPQIYRLLQLVNTSHSSAKDLRSAIVGEQGISEQDFDSYLVYCSGVFCNMGNYKGFGDSKFIPDMQPEVFEKIIMSSNAGKSDPTAMSQLWDSVKEPMFSLSSKEKQLGLGGQGITKYFSKNCDEKDAELVNRFFQEAKIEGYMNRVIKTQEAIEVRHAAVECFLSERKTFEGKNFLVTAGDYGKLLEKVNGELKEAAKYVANEHEKEMLDCYIKSFQNGDLSAHKDGSRHWIKNKSPAIETYIGFIETYRDPVGMRAEFEGFVAMVNREQSAKFQRLVEEAENIIPKLPWDNAFEKDTFLKPDFTSLDVLTFAGSMVPAGINIPNYDEIRQSEGFKNVSLGNVLTASYKSDNLVPFLSDEDRNVMEKYRLPSFEVQVGLHELLGHGSGKLFQENADGTFNFPKADVKDEMNRDINKWYKTGETYDSKFTSLSSTFEECRAECVGLYLSCDKEILKIFSHLDPAEAGNIIYSNWLSLCQAGISGLEMYSTDSGEWKQAHSQARFVILRALLDSGAGFVQVAETKGEDGAPDMLLTLDRERILSDGRRVIGDVLRRMQREKSTGDIESAREWYDKYSQVDDTWRTRREIAIARKRPRKMIVQANTRTDGADVKLLEYEANHEGMLDSWRDRFMNEEHREIDQILNELYSKDLPHF